MSRILIHPGPTLLRGSIRIWVAEGHRNPGLGANRRVDNIYKTLHGEKTSGDLIGITSDVGDWVTHYAHYQPKAPRTPQVSKPYSDPNTSSHGCADWCLLTCRPPVAYNCGLRSHGA